jgi:hypothetical protein
MRAWLKSNRPDLWTERGRLNEDQLDAYKMGTDDDEPIPAATDSGVSDADFADEAEPSEPLRPERAPRTGRQTRTEDRQATRKRRGGLLGRLLEPQAPAPKGKGKSKVSRVSLDKLIGRLYARGGQMISAVAPCTGRCLQAQAAMAGVILEDVAAGSIVDRFLQPAARAEDKLDKVFALAAPPALVFALEATDPADAVRRGLLMALLRESLTISMEVTGAYADAIKAKVEKDAANEAAVDELISLIFGVPQATAEPVPEPEMAGAAA